MNLLRFSVYTLLSIWSLIYVYRSFLPPKAKLPTKSFALPLHAQDFMITSQKMLIIHNPRLLNQKILENGEFVINTKDGYRISLTLDPQMQSAMNEHLSRFKVDFGAYIAIEPLSGKVLTISEYQNPDFQDSSDQPIFLRSSYPAASLFKIVTSAAALENGLLTPDQKIAIPGQCLHFRHKNWIRNPRKDKRQISLSDAFGSSCNIAFGRIALYLCGKTMLTQFAERMLFNRSIPFDFPLAPSMLYVNPDNQVTAIEVSEIGSGFGDTTISPIHAALLSAAVANQGVMMKPYVVKMIANHRGNLIYKAVEKSLATPFSPETARQLKKMMRRTITHGTSRTAFNQRGFPNVSAAVGGKTGTLDGENPEGTYTWFSGFAPLKKPQIASAALVVLKDRSIIKGTHLARIGFATFFNKRRIAERKQLLLAKYRKEDQ